MVRRREQCIKGCCIVQTIFSSVLESTRPVNETPIFTLIISFNVSIAHRREWWEVDRREGVLGMPVQRLRREIRSEVISWSSIHGLVWQRQKLFHNIRGGQTMCRIR